MEAKQIHPLFLGLLDFRETYLVFEPAAGTGPRATLGSAKSVGVGPAAHPQARLREEEPRLGGRRRKGEQFRGTLAPHALPRRLALLREAGVPPLERFHLLPLERYWESGGGGGEGHLFG